MSVLGKGGPSTKGVRGFNKHNKIILTCFASAFMLP